MSDGSARTLPSRIGSPMGLLGPWRRRPFSPALCITCFDAETGLEDARTKDDPMSATRSAWRMVRPNGRPSRCLISKINGHHDVVVWNGPSIVLWERFHTAEEAQGRADELWTMLVAHGCEPSAGERFETEPGTP